MTQTVNGYHVGSYVSVAQLRQSNGPRFRGLAMSEKTSKHSYAHAQEIPILDDIERRTGLFFERLQHVGTDSISKVLPIIAEWVPRSSEHLRFCLFSMFQTPRAAPYLENLIRWRRSETYTLSRNTLTQALALQVTDKTARQIWDGIADLEPSGLECLLLAKLAGTREVAVDVVRSRILPYLTEAEARIERSERIRSFGLSALQTYSRIPHPQVRAWFARHRDSADPDLRRLSRGSSRRKKSPPGCRYSSAEPDLKRELMSSGADLASLSEFLTELQDQFDIEPPLTSPAKLSEAILDRGWLVCTLNRKTAGPIDLWLRLEDVDVLEARLISAVDQHSGSS